MISVSGYQKLPEGLGGGGRERLYFGIFQYQIFFYIFFLKISERSPGLQKKIIPLLHSLYRLSTLVFLSRELNLDIESVGDVVNYEKTSNVGKIKNAFKHLTERNSKFSLPDAQSASMCKFIKFLITIAHPNYGEKKTKEMRK